MKKIEQKWQKIWEENKAFEVEINSNKPKYYVLEMLPYPSGKIHMGHLRNYSIGDVIARYMMLNGYNVLHPMGWDAFGLPAENAAISNKSSPAEWTISNINSMKEQLKSIGFSYDWRREITSCDPQYFKHEQKFFLKLYEKGLAYRKESVVNWDPVDETVLANEQVIDGKGWRSGAVVERKYLKQWFLKITDYAEELLQELPNLQGWPESLRRMQEKWIGKSEGATFAFSIDGTSDKIEVFSSRPETIFGASFIGLAYNHPIINALKDKSKELKTFIEKCAKTSTAAADIEKAVKEGAFTGIYAKHPFDEKIKIPVVVANYVLLDYGSGAVFGCPAHDERDYELANKLALPIKQVINNPDIKVDVLTSPYLGQGTMVNSVFLDNLSAQEARNKVIEEFERLKIGSRQINYRLKDWGVSRQRFWGCPIPIIYCPACGSIPVPEKDLPVELPEAVSFDKGGNPLDHIESWKNVSCPKCASPAIRETDTFDTFFESSWYFTRYCDNKAADMTGKEACDYWLPVDQYIGGIEHAVLHLLYARFFTKVMNDLGHVSIREPFIKMLNQGMVLHATYKDEEGNWLYPNEVDRVGDRLIHKVSRKDVVEGKTEKMSKSKKNVIDLETMLESYGADVIRLFVLSDSPPEKDLEWSLSGIEGASRFITRLQNFSEELYLKPVTPGARNQKLLSLVHFTIKYVSEDIKEYRLNKAIARVRELFNEILKESEDILTCRFGIEIILQLLNPFIPHITEELWEKTGHQDRLYNCNWPLYDEKMLKIDSYTLAIQVNGKLRASCEIKSGSSEEEIKLIVMSLANVIKHIEGKPIKKFIIIPGKIANIVI